MRLFYSKKYIVHIAGIILQLTALQSNFQTIYCSRIVLNYCKVIFTMPRVESHAKFSLTANFSRGVNRENIKKQSCIIF